MGRYDWEEKQRRRDALKAAPRRGGSRGRVIVFFALVCALGASAVSWATLDKSAGSYPEPSNSPLPSSNVRQLIGERQPAPQAVQPVLKATTAFAEQKSVTYRFELCGQIRTTCVVDGDTIWLDGEKIRIADIDAPEVSEPKCASEKALGDRATLRLMSLLNEGPFQVQTIGNRDEDRYGRKLRVLVRAEKSLGDQLVSEGLARTWTGRREPWC